jgi:antitoxin PrlF
MASSYNGKITTTGSSEAIRLDKALFRQHPEFKRHSKVRAHVIGPGQILVSLSEEPAFEGDDYDPVMNAYLSFLAQDMVMHPEHLKPFTSQEMEYSKALVAGVTVSDDDIIPEDVTL